jgi:Xaa-Pro aminopeptidase
MRACKKARTEYELEAELRYDMMRQGCRDMAYDPIVASGANACVLHYTANQEPLKPGDLVLIDAGGEFQNYAADVTRVFPVSGKFTEEQRLIYQLVLDAQKAGIAAVRPGARWDDIQRVMVKILTQGLVELEILTGALHDLIEQEAYKPFYMHGSGHWLGLDVHDCGAYKIDDTWRSLKPGMVLTVEPGLYISPGAAVNKRFWGIGVRIEDDILVTKTGHQNLTGKLMVEVDDIEAYLRD